MSDTAALVVAHFERFVPTSDADFERFVSDTAALVVGDMGWDASPTYAGMVLSSDEVERLGFTRPEVVGRGATGPVYRAIHVASGRDVAVKLFTGVDRARAEREAEMLSQVRHPQLVEIVAHGDADDLLYLATEWIDGAPLRAHLERGPVATATALRWAVDIAAGLSALHDQGLVHRDLTPGNVMIGADGRATVIDFGLVRGDESDTVTSEGMTAGTPRYVAPEVLSGQAASPASDQYSLALVLHEMLTGRWAFPASEHAAGALHHQVKTPPEPLREADPYQPPALEAALLRALEKDPAARFATVDGFVAAARTIDSEAEPSAPAPSRRRTLPALVGGLAVAGLVGLGVGWWLGGESAGSPADETVAEPTATVAPSAVDPASSTVADVASPATTTSPAESAPAPAPSIASTAIEWAAGTAAGLSCNLLDDVDFDTRVPSENYYADPDRPELVRQAERRGVDGTGALQVGESGEYGLYGRIVPVEAGASYVFSAHAAVAGGEGSAELGILWLDAEYGELPDDVRADLPGERRSTIEATPPAAAAFAVPFVFKAGTQTELYVDEMVMARADADCRLLLGDAS